MVASLYPRQFFASYEPSQKCGDWCHFFFGTLNIYAHPLLETTFVESRELQRRALLLGSILNPCHPLSTNRDILSDLVESSLCADSLCEQLYCLGGRFLIFFSNQTDTYLIGDACGLRTACYTLDNPFTLASQPLLLKEHRALREASYCDAYRSSPYVRNNKEYWIPITASLFENTCHLQPNHYLRLSDRRQIRFWPRARCGTPEHGSRIQESGLILQRLITAASQRYELALPITAGLDSRTLLAAARPVADSVFYYTLRYRGLTDASPDIAIPRALLNGLHLPHHIIECSQEAPPDFQALYAQNTFPAHINDWAHIAYGLCLSYPSNAVCIKGNCSEIARCFYYPYGRPPDGITEEFLGALEYGWQQHPFIMTALKTWLKASEDVFQEARVNVLDMFYWEHRMGSWQAQSQLEWDIAQETISPFNHRQLLHFMLMTPTSERCAPRYHMHQSIIRNLWSETLDQPINPTSVGNNCAMLARFIANRVGVDWQLKTFSRWLGLG